MAYYKSGDYLRESTNELFDALLDPEDICFHSGIYRCEACGFEVVTALGGSLPPKNHHEHSASQGAIRWRLIVGTDL